MSSRGAVAADPGLFEAVVENGQRRLKYSNDSLKAKLTGLQLLDEITDSYLGGIVSRLGNPADGALFRAVQSLDALIFSETAAFFADRGTKWCNLPQTTRMISSPGAVYRGQALDYTTDTLPVELSWFGSDRPIYLSESSQFYLELHLLTGKWREVFAIYNSFRKEEADRFHLSEFQHIEFEGLIDQAENVAIAQGLVTRIVQAVLRSRDADLLRFIEGQESRLSSVLADWIPLRFPEAMRVLAEDTGDMSYTHAGLDRFGAWEEVRLTRLLGGTVALSGFPVAEVPFYHESRRDRSNRDLTESTDIIFPGFREVIGSGRRIADPQALREKAVRFNLPLSDYEPYLQSRDYGGGLTAGFGMGWQRLAQWILGVPYIWLATVFPRTHLDPVP